MTKKVIFQDLGQIPYKEAWDYQQTLLAQSIEIKRANRGLTPTDPAYRTPQHHLLFCEHPPVYTLGKSGSIDHLLLNQEQLDEQGFEFYKINRGGDITYHGPGQIVAYPIFDLDEFFTDVHRYVRYLEEVIIRVIAEYGLAGTREKGYTGVWLGATDQLPKRKICAIGVHLSRWVTMHGLAFNVKPDLQHFGNIIPCGINDQDKSVSSVQQEIEQAVNYEAVKEKVKHYFADQFQFEYTTEAPPY